MKIILCRDSSQIGIAVIDCYNSKKNRKGKRERKRNKRSEKRKKKKSENRRNYMKRKIQKTSNSVKIQIRRQKISENR